MGKIVVFGATGAQGSSVVSALLAQAKHDVYGVTRSKSSASATAKEAGYKASAHWKGFVEADADKPETLPAAVAGADAVSAASEPKGCTIQMRGVRDVRSCWLSATWRQR